jgi:hypothetical protein
MKTCPKCSVENDDKRTVCLECGDNISAVIPSFGVSKPKLNESAGASAPQITRFKPPAPRKQLKKPSPWKSLFSLRSLIAWAFLAALIYAFYLALTPMNNDVDLRTRGTARDTHASYEITHIPTQESSISTLKPPAPLPQDDEICATQIRSLKAAAASSNGTWSISKNALNQFLATRVRLTPMKNQLGIHTSFEGCFANLHEGYLDFVMKQHVYDRDLIFTLRLQPLPKANGSTIDFTDAWIGSLPIHPMLIPALLPVFRPCYESIRNALAPLKSASSISISPVSVIVRWPESSVK